MYQQLSMQNKILSPSQFISYWETGDPWASLGPSGKVLPNIECELSAKWDNSDNN